MSIGRKVLVDGVEYRSVRAAALEIGAKVECLTQAFRNGQGTYRSRGSMIVHSIAYAPDEPEPVVAAEPVSEPEPAAEVEPPARTHGTALLRGICTHRLGTYGGMRA